MKDEAYFRERFLPDPRRRITYATLIDVLFKKEIPADGTFLELGAGYGDFINSVKARRRIAVDRWPGMLQHLEPGIEGLITTVDCLEQLKQNSVDYVFSSNCFEHIKQSELVECLAHLQRVMKPGARLTILQPNFKYAFRDYFDDYTHVSIYTHISLANLLAANGFRVDRVVPRLLPLTIKSRFPVHPFLIRLYLASPVRPLARQMLISALR
jgi:ubiquinone/menaquinone biosynthesis C-methylase UbiE